MNLARIGRARAPGGFTLAELLVTITVIGIMMGIIFGVMQSAQQSARTAKTKATINKINAFIMAKYDSYRTRRVQFDLAQYVQAPAEASGRFGGYGITPPRPREVARARLNGIRDLMRQEMPDRWSDVVTHTSSSSSITLRGPEIKFKPVSSVNTYVPDTPALGYRYYYAYYDAWQSPTSMTAKDKYAAFQANGNAECLYLIVMAMPDAASQFAADEIADTDGDGLLEFIDGWKRPIYFLRWPAGFLGVSALDSGIDLKADTNLQSDVQVTATSNNLAGALHPDPFDPQRVFPANYAIYPLIYSAGRDGQYDINTGWLKDSSNQDVSLTYSADASRNLDPYVRDGNGKRVGTPDNLQNPSDLRHYDNIHNQRNEVR